jgi:ribosomal protein S18 acetylase RimI-like enzyme
VADVVLRAQGRGVNNSNDGSFESAASASDPSTPAARQEVRGQAQAGSSLLPLIGGAVLIVPQSPADLDRYFDLRWRVLRAPWNQPRGSERDTREDESVHMMIRSEAGAALAVGRLHLNSPVEAQVRFMAVDPDAQNRQLGSTLLRALEARARDAGAKYLVLNARSTALRFYERHGYHIEAPAERLFAEVEHWRMRKELQSA